MRKLLLSIICLSFITSNTIAQDDEGFKKVLEAEFENKAKVMSLINADGSIIIGSDDNEATTLDGTGKVLWSGKFKEINGKEGAGESEYQYFIPAANILFLFDKKTGKDHVSVLDVKTGKNLWNAQEYQNLTEENIEYINELDAFLFSLKSEVVMVNARTGQKIWETSILKGSIGNYLYMASTKELILINYKPTALAALFTGFKNQLVRISAVNGDVKWEATYAGFVEKEAVTRKPLVKLKLKDDKVFVQLDGLQVFNYETGKSLWSAVYETDQDVRKGFWNRGPHGGKVLRGGVYGAIAEPLVTSSAVYIVLGSDKLKTKFIEKYELGTGKKIWSTEKLSNSLAIPALHVEGDRVVVQVGGMVNKQTVENVTVRNSSGGYDQTTYYNYEYVFMGIYDIIALDDATGKKAWRSEKFDKRITNLVFDDGMVFAASGDEFYGFDVKTGEMKINVDHSKGKVGKSMWAFDNGDNIALVCDNGIAAYKKKDGSTVYTTDKFRNITNYHLLGDNFFIRREKENSNTIAGVDLKTGTIKGVVKSKGKGGGSVFGDGLDLTSDGEYIFAFKGKGIDKLKVNK